MDKINIKIIYHSLIEQIFNKCLCCAWGSSPPWKMVVPGTGVGRGLPSLRAIQAQGVGSNCESLGQGPGRGLREHSIWVVWGEFKKGAPWNVRAGSGVEV